MDREKLTRECLMFYCFLEGINSHEKARIARIADHLRMLTDGKLQECYNSNLQQKELRIDRFLTY